MSTTVTPCNFIHFRLKQQKVKACSVRRNGDVLIRSPGNTGTVTLPGSFVERSDLGDLIEEFTRTAAGEEYLAVSHPQ